MAKYANQKHLRIVKEDPKYNPPFLQIAESDWHYAFQDLSPTAFAIYLQLAQNQNNYELDYSPQAIENTGLMTRPTAQKRYDELEEKGYIIDGVFYVRPPKRVVELEQLKNEPITEDDF